MPEQSKKSGPWSVRKSGPSMKSGPFIGKPSGSYAGSPRRGSMSSKKMSGSKHRSY